MKSKHLKDSYFILISPIIWIFISILGLVSLLVSLLNLRKALTTKTTSPKMLSQDEIESLLVKQHHQ